MPMSSIELRSERAGPSDGSDVPPDGANNRSNIRPRMRVAPILITLGTVAVAALRAWATWQVYMAAPWTRDGTVRAYVVTKAPEVAGRIVKLPVADNQFVHKGDLLMLIDPTDYRIAVDLTEAATQQTKATAENAQREAERRRKLTDLAETVEDRQTHEAN